VENIVKHMTEKCLEYFFPGPDTAIDETTSIQRTCCISHEQPTETNKVGTEGLFWPIPTLDMYFVELHYGREITESLARPDLSDWLMEVASMNSFILFQLCEQMKNEQPLTHLQYRKQLITGLVGTVSNHLVDNSVITGVMYCS